MNDTFDVLITHERHEEHQLVRIRGKRGKLTQGNVQVLLALAAGRARPGTGYVIDPESCYPVAICRLRQALQRILRSASGKAFIERGCGQEYRLKPDLTIAMTQDFAAHLQRNDAALLEQLQRASVAIVASLEPDCLECASTAQSS